MENNNSSEKVKAKIIESVNLSEDKLSKKSKIRAKWFEIILITLLAILIFTIGYGIILIKSYTGTVKEQKWEYKTLTITQQTKNNRIGTGAGDFNMIEPSESQLNELGSDGWELVTSYLEMETAFPNFTGQKYVTGIQANIRPQDVVLIFKRQVRG